MGWVVLATAATLAWGLSHVATSIAATGEHGHELAVVDPSSGETESGHNEPPVLERHDLVDSGTTSRNSTATQDAVHDDANTDTGH